MPLENVTPWLQFIVYLGGALGVVVGGMGIGWRVFGRAAMRSAIDDSLGYELGRNGDDHELPEEEHGAPLRTLVIRSRVAGLKHENDLDAIKADLEEGRRKFRDIEARLERGGL